MNYSQTPEDWGGKEALETAWWAYREYMTATTPGEQADYLIKLSNAMSDLVSWHPKYNYETGMIDGVYEED